MATCWLPVEQTRACKSGFRQETPSTPSSTSARQSAASVGLQTMSYWQQEHWAAEPTRFLSGPGASSNRLRILSFTRWPFRQTVTSSRWHSITAISVSTRRLRAMPEHFTAIKERLYVWHGHLMARKSPVVEQITPLVS